MIDADRRELRRQLRAARRALSAAQRDRLSRLLCRRVADLAIYRNAVRVALYAPFDGEPDPGALYASGGTAKEFYLPVIQAPKTPLRFARYRPGDPTVSNRLTIAEPVTTQQRTVCYLAPEQLDLVITPLVGFDQRGTRLGVGGGYYDRSFAFLPQARHQQRKRPTLLGFALELQKLDRLPRQPWDVPLDAVVTETEVYPGEF